MKKIKSPWYGIVWIVIWTAALVWFLMLERFNERESIGLVLVWLILVGVTVYVLYQNWWTTSRGRASRSVPRTFQALRQPARNSACPCGSGKKYKRCCGSDAPSGSGSTS